MKLCSICKISKKLDNFYKDSCRPDGRRSECKECRKKSICKEKEADRQKEYYYTRKSLGYDVTKSRREYYYKNREHCIKTVIEYRKNRITEDLEFKISTRLRSRLYNAIKNNYSSGEAVKRLGCTIEEFKKYIESKFKEGMTWDNWNRYGWHIDHIIPLCKFDLTKQNEVLKACHYTNLQPMWAKDNLKKGGNLQIDYEWDLDNEDYVY